MLPTPPLSSIPQTIKDLQKNELTEDEISAKLGPKPADVDLAKAILDFVAGYIEIVPESPYSYHTTSVLDVLDNRTGDCTEHSQLFVTLARAAGLPAREVSGFVYGGDDRNPSLGGHAWVEVMIDGQWVGMDPTWEEVRLNKSHVQTRDILVPSLAFEVVDITYH
jgi:transglutaminase-like putative cysteine protease